MLSMTSEFPMEQNKQTSETKAHIMIVDDNVELLEELENLLIMRGYKVTALSDGTKVFDLALMDRPNLFLLDLKMSPKSGFQIADELRNSMFLKDVPVVAMTGFFTEKQHYLMMKLCGIKTSILKPFSPFLLLAKIEFALGNRLGAGDEDEA